MSVALESKPQSAIASQENYDYEARRYNDVTTWLAEVLDGSMRTAFEYRYQDGELYADCGSPLAPIFDQSIEQAKDLPTYELRRRQIEKAEYEDMISMAKGEAPNTMVVVSDFPPELMEATDDVGGYNVSRKQTMLRVVTRRPDGTIGMTSQSLDGSNRWALEEVCRAVGYEPMKGELLGQRIQLELDMVNQEFLIDRLTDVYDRSMGILFGSRWHAGVRSADSVGSHTNTYDFVCQQKDLLTAYLAKSDSFTGGWLDYGLAAAMRDRFSNNNNTLNVVIQPLHTGVVSYAMAVHEMELAAEQASVKGDVFSGCGASIGLATAENQYRQLGFGNISQESGPSDKFGPLKFKCKNGHWNQRPRNKLITSCKVHSCKNSVAC